MATTNYNLDDSHITWSAYWVNCYQAGSTDQMCKYVSTSLGQLADFSFAGTGCQILCATNSTAPVIQYNLDGGGWTTLTGIPGSGAFALVNVGSQALSDTTHTMRIQLISGTANNFWWQFTNGVAITGSSPSLSMTSGLSQNIYNLTTQDAQRKIILDGAWAPWTTSPTFLSPGSPSNTDIGQDAGLRFVGNPTDIKVFLYSLGSARIHLYQDGIDLGFTAVAGTSLYDWVSVVPSGVTLDGSVHTYEIRYTQASASYNQAIMLVGGDITADSTWLPSLLVLSDSISYNDQKLIRGKFTNNVTMTNGSTAVTGTGFTGQTAFGVALATGQYMTAVNSPAGPWYKITVNSNTSITIAPAYAGGTFTGPAWYSDWTTTNDTAQGWVDQLCRTRGYSPLNCGHAGQPTWTHHATAGLEERLLSLAHLPVYYRGQIQGVIVRHGQNDTKYANIISSVATFSSGAATQITCSATPTGIANGQTFQITSATGNTSINGTWTISNVSGATFVIPVAFSAGYNANTGISHRPTYDLWYSAMTRVLTKVLKMFGEVPIIVLGIPNYSSGATINGYYSAGMSAICTSLGSPLAYLDMASVLNGGSGTVTSDTTDGLHLNEWGHYKYAQAIQSSLQSAASISGGGGLLRQSSMNG